MNKTEKILACLGNITLKSIPNVVGCTYQSVYNVRNMQNPVKKRKTAKPRKKAPKKPEKIPKNKQFQYMENMQVWIKGDSRMWTVKFVGRETLTVVRGLDKKVILKEKINRTNTPNEA